MTATIRVLPDCAAVCAEAAAVMLKLLKNPRLQGPVSVALSGGSTPLGMFRLLASDGYRDKISWERVHFFWTDERCVPPGHVDSNYGAANRLMLSRLPIPPSNVHRIKGELSPDEAAQEYERDIRAYFIDQGNEAFDLVFLGVGEDGHTASLFPGTSQLSEQDRIAVPSYSESRRSWRVTLTLSIINNASHVVFLVCGNIKAAILKDVIEVRQGLPAGLIDPKEGRLTWLIDMGSAAMLEARY